MLLEGMRACRAETGPREFFTNTEGPERISHKISLGAHGFLKALMLSASVNALTDAPEGAPQVERVNAHSI